MLYIDFTNKNTLCLDSGGFFAVAFKAMGVFLGSSKQKGANQLSTQKPLKTLRFQGFGQYGGRGRSFLISCMECPGTPYPHFRAHLSRPPTILFFKKKQRS